MIFVYIKSKTTGATYQCSCVLLNLCFFLLFLFIVFPRGNVLLDVDVNPSDFISYKKMKNLKITTMSEQFQNKI